MSVVTQLQSRRTLAGRRRRTTSRRVLLADRAARIAITLGGTGTILAVLLVCAFLASVVIPLFLPSGLQQLDAWPANNSPHAAAVHLLVDEHMSLVCAVRADGSLESYRADNGQLLSRRVLPVDGQPVAWSYPSGDGRLTLALDDASIRLGTLRVATEFVAEEELPESFRTLQPGQLTPYEGGLAQRTSEGQFRIQQIEVELQDPLRIDTDAPILLIDQSVSSRGRIVAVVTGDGRLRLAHVTERKNLLTGKTTAQLREGSTEIEFPEGNPPSYLLLSGLGDFALLAWDDGYAQRFDTRNVTRPVLCETLNLVPQPGVELTSLAFLVGKSSLAAGDAEGGLHVWFRTRPAVPETLDGTVLVRARSLPGGAAPVRRLAASPRSRLLGAGYADGSVQLFHVTSGRRIADLPGGQLAGPLQALALAPRDDGLLAWTSQGLQAWEIQAPHPEVTPAAILRPVWYEGYEGPEHVWQSSAGTDDFEEKYGLAPLILGTLKATFYSMLFGAPLALLAAIYTSEFLSPRAKARVKPTIEIMAGLPSVVLGFLAAIVFAPLVEQIVPECLTALFTVPVAYLLGASLWQLLPSRMAARLGVLRMLALLLPLPVGLALAALLGGSVEQWLFAGDIRAWLDGQRGTGTAGWLLLVLPVSALAVAWFSAIRVTPALRSWAGHWTPSLFALLSLARLLLAVAATILLALLLAWLLNLTIGDLRGSLLGTYVQRNALVVGFVMGFAIIPIIYTISDDALSAVPQSLRAASLGAGATPWQTALRIVIPTAMSGLFSALMIGLGRAVGETMIVLMAAGNTPLMDWNIFNGFRTLSANIAVELPEAVINSTHYRMLFLTALTLFGMTFLINTVAELVRLRFRKRAFQL